MENKKETLQITGMTCASCAAAIERSVAKVPGVISSSVNFATEQLTCVLGLRTQGGASLLTGVSGLRTHMGAPFC